VQGVRSNQLIGYGIVVGLAGTGDDQDATLRPIANMLMEFGITVDIDDIETDNAAAVMVTATLPPFAREGDTLDVTISSMGDADSLQGGTLLQTPLRAGNGEVYAVAQGAVSTGGFQAGRPRKGVQKNFPTVGTSPNAAIVERTVEEDELGANGSLSLSLSKADFTTASRVMGAINGQFGNIARAANPGRIDVNIPSYYRNNVVGFIAALEELPVTPDTIAKVVINERTGTIVMGGNVSVDEVAITQGGLTLRVTKDTEVSQPSPFSPGSTVITSNENTEVKEEKANSIVLPATTNISDIVGALNSVGATPRDIISILESLKASGALHADLEII
jgi:flagellar P-ring protein precursor FlgI